MNEDNLEGKCERYLAGRFDVFLPCHEHEDVTGGETKVNRQYLEE